MDPEIILKLLDVNEGNKWITHDAASFFNWISNNLSTKNILSESEFNAFNELLDISEDELKQQLLDIEYEFPGFFSITDEDVLEMEKKAAMLEEELNEHGDRILRMEEVEASELKALTKIEKQKIESDLEMKFLTEEVERKIERVESLRKGNAKKIENANKQLLQPTSTFMYQMPHDKYITSVNKFCVNLDVFMKQNLTIRKMSEETENNIPALNKERKKILELEGKILEDELSFGGLKYALDNVDSFLKFFSSNILETNVTVGDWKNDEEIMKEQFEVAVQELQMLVRQNSESMVLMDDHAKKKHAQNIEILKKLNRAQILTDDVATIASTLWAASQLDHKRLENRVDNSEEYENNLYECRKRIGQLERLNKDDSGSSTNVNALRKLQDIVRRYLSPTADKLHTVEACVGEILSYQERLNVLTQSIVEQKYHGRTMNLIKEINVQLLKLHPYVHKGPLFKPCLYDSSFFVEIHEKQKRKKELEGQYKEIRVQFQKRDAMYKDDQLFRMKELLPTWFLTEPRKVILAIKEVQKKAAEGGSSGYKALNITLGPMDMSKLN